MPSDGWPPTRTTVGLPVPQHVIASSRPSPTANLPSIDGLLSGSTGAVAASVGAGADGVAAAADEAGVAGTLDVPELGEQATTMATSAPNAGFMRIESSCPPAVRTGCPVGARGGAYDAHAGLRPTTQE